MFIIKLILTPLLIGGATLLSRKFGPVVGGWIVGLPLTSAPIAFFLALGQGNVFAAHAAVGMLMGLISDAAFFIVYEWLSLSAGWAVCWVVSWGAFFVATFVFEHFTLSLSMAFPSVLGALLFALLILPRQRGDVASMKPPAWDLPARMLVATAIVLALTEAAGALGPLLSGLLSPLPAFATILGVFTHHLQGASAARQLLRGVVVGAFASATFFVMVATLIVPLGISATFTLAIVGALLTQACSLWAMQKVESLALHSSKD